MLGLANTSNFYDIYKDCLIITAVSNLRLLESVCHYQTEINNHYLS